MSERVLLRVGKGVLMPADGFTQRVMRERGYNVGDHLIADLRKPRNPGFHRLMHAFGQLCVDNIDAFHGHDAHSALKRLQIDLDIACDHTAVQIDGVDVADYRVPQSLSYASMDQGKAEEVFTAMCRGVAEKYWPELTADQIAEMAELMAQGAAA